MPTDRNWFWKIRMNIFIMLVPFFLSHPFSSSKRYNSENFMFYRIKIKNSYFGSMKVTHLFQTTKQYSLNSLLPCEHLLLLPQPVRLRVLGVFQFKHRRTGRLTSSCFTFLPTGCSIS